MKMYDIPWSTRVTCGELIGLKRGSWSGI